MALSKEELREALAAIEHGRWADWQQYMHSKCGRLHGHLVVPASLVERWERQIATPYAELSEEEKDSDREQVDRYWSHVEELYSEIDRLTYALRIIPLRPAGF